MQTTEIPSPAELAELVHYRAEDGLLFWKPREDRHFAFCGDRGPALRKMWNSRFAFRPAFAAPNIEGYLKGALWGKSLSAHRVVWALHNHERPVPEIDHINGDKTDNRIQNLRPVSRMQNCRNKRIQKNNTSGVSGISKVGRKWLARFTDKGKRVRVGVYSDILEAERALREAREARGYSPDHGGARQCLHG